MKKDVALVLSSGGPRGFAYIGAIEELESRGYQINSVVGTSIGSLIGGIYAAGKLNEFKEWIFSVDKWKVFTLMDFSIGSNHVVKGDKIIEALKEIVPDTDIEDLNIPFRASAADIYTGEEFIFDRGPLFDAIRASISIPSLFRPVKYSYRTLIDGGIVNTLPISLSPRKEDEILIAFDVNDIDIDSVRHSLINEREYEEEKIAEEEKREMEKNAVIKAVRYDDNLTFVEKMKLASAQAYKSLGSLFENDEKPEMSFEKADGYFSLLSRTFSVMNHINAKMSAQMYKPDILIKMPFDAYSNISDYTKAHEIADLGKELMRNALNEFETKQ